MVAAEAETVTGAVAKSAPTGPPRMMSPPLEMKARSKLEEGTVVLIGPVMEMSAGAAAVRMGELWPRRTGPSMVMEPGPATERLPKRVVSPVRDCDPAVVTLTTEMVEPAAVKAVGEGTPVGPMSAVKAIAPVPALTASGP